ncbi:MAG TPA: alpha/beta hydrolase [Candidatus Dormibacteraeota bacterium]|nr:alpha/beta hydrolase [Candidatus Dormibacteraeota bacterium]
MNIEKGRLQANGISFSVLAAGRRDRPVALLLHGFPEGKESWEPQLLALAEAGWRAVAPDLRGFGGTDAPKGVDAYALPHLVADVEGLISALGEDQVDLVGHDWGALVGWPFVSRNPKLVRTWTALSVPHPVALAQASGLDGGPHPDPDQRQRSSYIGLFQKAGRAEEVMLEDGAKRLRSFYEVGPDPDAIPDEVVDLWVKGFQRPGRLTAGLDYYRANLKPAAYAAYPPVPKPITTSTLLLWGDQDPALGRLAVERTADLVKGPYRLQILEGAGHWLQFERPDAVSRAVVEHARAAAERGE